MEITRLVNATDDATFQNPFDNLPDPATAQRELIRIIFAWFHQLDHQRIVTIYELNGGWEGWAQVELALSVDVLLHRKLGKHLVEREPQGKYIGLQRADLLIRSNEAYRGLLPFVIELKCESYKQRDNFNRNVFGDIGKLSEINRNTLKAIPILIVISITMENTDYIRNLFSKYPNLNGISSQSTVTQFITTTPATVSPAIHIAIYQ
ncbi:hypothetical protein WME90_31940 [Sorangium sp. So ce375]|uniref:hypothetical protein n=1 Tax=Sorangium sp. So ce375 TaxID=3133306 RepID=UPI003F5B099E